MKKNIFIVLFVVLMLMILTSCSCSLKIGGDSGGDLDEELTYDDFDDSALDLAEKNIAWHTARMELTMMIYDGEDMGDILAKYDEVEEITADIQEVLDTMIAIDNAFVESDAGEVIARMKTSYANTAYADHHNTGGLDTRLPDLGRTEGLLDAVNVFGNPFRIQNEAMRMGIYTAYHDLEDTYGAEAVNVLDDALAESGIDDIEDIFYCETECVQDFWNARHTLDDGFGDRVDWHTPDIEEALAEGSTDDIYAFMDNLTGEYLDEELEAGQYEEYLPRNLADFMIRNVGYNEFEDYIDHRRDTQLQIKNEKLEELENQINLNIQDIYDEFADTIEENNYYSDGYDPDDDKEVVIAIDNETGNVIVTEIDTDESNGLNLPEGNYSIISTTDGNVPMVAMDVDVKEGETTVLHNNTYDPELEMPGVLNFLTQLGQMQVTVPTNSDLEDLRIQLSIQDQLKLQLEHDLEILRSMEGGTFTYVSPEARDKLNRQLSEVQDEIRRLEEELGFKQDIRDDYEEMLEKEEIEDFMDELDGGSDEVYDGEIEMEHAYGTWENGQTSGSIDLEFSTGGGPVTGYFESCFGGDCWSSTASGTFSGGAEGTVSGSISGSGSAPTGTGDFINYTISGSFSGTVYLNRDFAEGTFTTTTSADGHSYGDRGTWVAAF